MANLIEDALAGSFKGHGAQPNKQQDYYGSALFR